MPVRTDAEATAYQASIPGHVAATSPGDVIAFDLHTWHASSGGRDRLAATAVYQRCPETESERDRTLRSVHDGFEQAFRGFDTGRYPTWRDWLADAAAHPRRAAVIERMRQAGCWTCPAPWRAGDRRAACRGQPGGPPARARVLRRRGYPAAAALPPAQAGAGLGRRPARRPRGVGPGAARRDVLGRAPAPRDMGGQSAGAGHR